MHGAWGMDYDAVIVGGGLAGSSLANTFARNGGRVFIVEREPQFRDRIRGEGMLPWGAGEARRLGIHEALLDRCAQEARWWTAPDDNRDLIETTPDGVGCLDFYHPEMQQCLLDLAVESGAELWRPAEAIDVVRGDPPRVRVRANGSEREISARLVVGADGRNSRVRGQAGLTERRDPICLTCTGVLYRDLALPEDAVQFVMNPTVQRLSIIFPVGQKRFRAYIAARQDAGISFHGRDDAARFVKESVVIGAAAEWFAPGAAIGPLASFNAPDVWAEHPYCDGIVLIGDAATASDPCFGCGLSLTLRDVRVLSEALAATDDWRAAADHYAAEHDRYTADLRRVHSWFRELWFGAGPAAEALRARAMPRFAEDPSRIADFIGCGPEAPSDETARRRFFAED